MISMCGKIFAGRVAKASAPLGQAISGGGGDGGARRAQSCRGWRRRFSWKIFRGDDFFEFNAGAGPLFESRTALPCAVKATGGWCCVAARGR